MALAVHEALKLKVLERFKLVAGLSGLDRKINYVGIIDHEEIGDIRGSVRVGEFILTNFLIIRDQPEKIVNYIEEMIEGQAACLAIKSIYFDSIPDEAIELADAKQFPVFIFDETFLDTLVVEIDKVLNMYGHEKRIRMLIDQIITSQLNGFRIREMAYELNRSFKNSFIAYYIEEDEKLEDERTGLFNFNSLSQMLGDGGLAIHYRDGYLIIASYDVEDKHQVSQMAETTLQASGAFNGCQRIGISKPKDDLGDIGRAVSECLYASEYAFTQDKKEVFFEDIGVYQILFPLINDPWVHSFYKGIINKLIEQDSKQGTDLLNTAIIYIQCEGDMQETSQKLFQHTNTIRYRIRKIAKLMNVEQLKGMAYESLAMAIRLYLISNRI